MKMTMKREVIIILLCCIAISIFISLYMPTYPYIENFDSAVYKDMGLGDTNHTVNLPINTTYECENKCMPPARCSITGEQCSSDIDCCGCNPYVEGFTSSMNDITSTTFENPPQYFKGIDMWSDSFNYGAELYNKQHNPLLQTARYGQNNILLNYPDRQTLSGDFTESGAYPYSLIRRIH